MPPPVLTGALVALGAPAGGLALPSLPSLPSGLPAVAAGLNHLPALAVEHGTGGAEALGAGLLLGSVVLLLAIGAARVSAGLGLPSLLLFFGLGLLFGHTGIVRFTDFDEAEAIGLAALVVILAEGGLTTRWRDVRPALAPAGALSTVGVAVSMLVTAAVVHLVLGSDWRIALLTGAVLAPTDAAAVFATLRRVPVRLRLRAVLEAESGTNDPLAVLLVTLIAGSSWGHANPAVMIGTALWQVLAGAVVGVAVGLVAARLLGRIPLPVSALYALAVLGCCGLAYGTAWLIGGSGFLAVYLAALAIGNGDVPYRVPTLGFIEGSAWFAQIGVFVMLGMLADPNGLADALVPGFMISVVLLLVARPLAVALSCTPFGMPWREQAFLSWAGLRGAVPIVLALIPVTAGLPGAVRAFEIAVVVVLVMTLVQGPTLAWVARRLRVEDRRHPDDVQVEVAPLEQMHAQLLQVGVPPSSRLHGVEVGNLRLPTGAAVTLVVRGDRSVVPGPDFRLRHDDTLLVVTTSVARAATESRLLAVSRHGPLAKWLTEPTDARSGLRRRRVSAAQPRRAAGPVPPGGSGPAGGDGPGASRRATEAGRR